MAGKVDDPNNPTVDDFAGQVRVLNRRIKSIDSKMSDLLSTSPHVKRFVAYIGVMEEYQALMKSYLEQCGYLYAIKEDEDEPQ